MDGNSDNTPGPAGSTGWGMLEARIVAAQAAARVMAIMVEEALQSPHPNPAAHQHDGLALLLDSITCSALSISTMDMMRRTSEVAEAFSAATGRPSGSTQPAR